jgi:DNA repair protein RecO (recombination protein O)
LSAPTYKTKGIVLRTVKYGDTSIIVTIYTALFGTQAYLVNGVRTTTKKGSGKANLFQPGAILDLVVYHHELKHLNRIKEFKWSIVYQQIFSEVHKNAVALFIVELLTKCVRQPETNEDLFYFIEDCLAYLDTCHDTIAANIPLFVALHLPYHFGFRMTDNYSPARCYLDLQEGMFTEDPPHHPAFLADKQAAITAQLLNVMQLAELASFQLHHHFRRQLLHAYETYYSLHVADFGKLNTLHVLSEVLD